MVHRSYCGLGSREAALRVFEDLAVHAARLLELRAGCAWGGADHAAMGVAFDGLQTAAYHFTRRPHFYHALEADWPPQPAGKGRLADRGEAIAEFESLTPYADRLLALQGQCRPFGRDYLALGIARQCLDTAAFHFTRVAHFYGARGDSAGPVGPPR